MAALGNLRQEPSFRDEEKLWPACLKCTTGPDNTYTDKGLTGRIR